MRSLRYKKLIGVLTLAGIVSLVSCTEYKRHRTLNFFFDGVPPLAGDQAAAGDRVDDSQADPRRRPDKVWVIHDPVLRAPQKNCGLRCHGEQKKSGFSREVNLVAGVPDLCYQCHEPPSVSQGWIHGPVAAGECVICHEPHRSENPFLLKKPLPEMCYLCHDAKDIALIDSHDKPTYARCTDCHSGHSSLANDLLKVVPSGRYGQSQTSAQTLYEHFDGLMAAVRNELQHTRDVNSVLDAVATYVQQGELPSARAYLIALRSLFDLSDLHMRRVTTLHQQVDGKEKRLKQHNAQQRQSRSAQVAKVYYTSLSQYRQGQLALARQGFQQVLASDVVPDALKETVKAYLDVIDKSLAKRNGGR